MATVISRKVASFPERTASATWEKISTLLASDSKSDGRNELDKVAGIGCSSISSQATKNDAIIVWGSGPQVRIYCAFGDDASLKDDVDETGLQKCPTEGKWMMSIPCLSEDLKWTNKKLKSISSRITARAIGEEVDFEEQTERNSTVATIEINKEEFLKI